MTHTKIKHDPIMFQFIVSMPNIPPLKMMPTKKAKQIIDAIIFFILGNRCNLKIHSSIIGRIRIINKKSFKEKLEEVAIGCGG
jgi:hypothetical protein